MQLDCSGHNWKLTEVHYSSGYTKNERIIKMI